MSENYTHINDDLLVKYLLAEASPEEVKQVQSWIAAGEANRQYLEQLETVWKESRKLAARSSVDENAAWQRFRQRITAPAEQQATIPMKKSFGWMRVAALFLLIIGAAAIGYVLFYKEGPIPQLALQTQNSVLVDTLPDGSVITLNKNSVLNYPEKFKGDSRMVSLKGEAFFNITPDRKKPFQIQVNDITVKVIGTSFNIRSNNGETEIIVETGIVQVTRNNKTVELRPKEKVVVKQQDSVLVTQKEEAQLHNYYRSKEFVCDNTPLWKLVEVLNEAYDVNIVIERTELRNLPLDVTFSNESLDVILQIIKETFNTHNIEVRKTADKIILR